MVSSNNMTARQYEAFDKGAVVSSMTSLSVTHDDESSTRSLAIAVGSPLHEQQQQPSVQARLYMKVPQLTVIYWVMKILATTIGETLADMVSMTYEVGYLYTSGILILLFIVSLVLQLLALRFVPPFYWAVILTSSLAGTAVSDFMDRTLHLGYAAGSGILVSILVAIFIAWYFLGERKGSDRLSVTVPMGRRSETFYWLAILFSNTLGTALGDFISDSSEGGYKTGAIVLGSIIAFLAIVGFLSRYWIPELERWIRVKAALMVIIYWMAFVLTRPFGAEIGDLLTKSPEAGGLGLGTEYSSLVLGIPLLVLVVFATWIELRPRPDLCITRADGIESSGKAQPTSTFNLCMDAILTPVLPCRFWGEHPIFNCSCCCGSSNNADDTGNSLSEP